MKGREINSERESGGGQRRGEEDNRKRLEKERKEGKVYIEIERCKSKGGGSIERGGGG